MSVDDRDLQIEIGTRLESNEEHSLGLYRDGSLRPGIIFFILEWGYVRLGGGWVGIWHALSGFNVYWNDFSLSSCL